MKSLSKFKQAFEKPAFDLDHETRMVQSRIISTLLEVIEAKGYSQADLEKLTGLKQPFISALFNIRKKLNMEHIALFQKALEIVLEPPSYLGSSKHKEKYYGEMDYAEFYSESIKPIDYQSIPRYFEFYKKDNQKKDDWAKTLVQEPCSQYKNPKSLDIKTLITCDYLK